MANKTSKREKPAPPGKEREDVPEMVDVSRLAIETLPMQRESWDELIPDDLPETDLPLGRDEFAARDPFSEDYANFREEQATLREAASWVDEKLREDLLSKPHLMQNPAENAVRGAAAVYRSLRDMIKRESAELMDSSVHSELVALRHELMARKAIVEAVNVGIKAQLDRLDQRIAEAAREESVGLLPPDEDEKAG